MKDKFTFEKLIAIKKSYSIEGECVVFSMRDFTYTALKPVWIENLSELNDIMTDDEYYIALNIITTKGKKRFYKGTLASCSKDNLFNFLNKELCKEMGCSRPFIISQLFSLQPKYVVSITEEGGIRYYSCE